MSLLATTGFDHDVYVNRFTRANFNWGSPGRFGRGRYATLTNGGHYVNFDLVAGEESPAMVVGFATRDTASPYTDLVNSSSLIRVYGDTGQEHLSVFWSSPAMSQYNIKARRGDGTVLGSSPVVALNEGVWHYWEIKFTIDDTAGSIQVRRDGVTILTLSNVDTRHGGSNANAYRVQFGNNANNSYGSLDDVYCIKNDGVGLTDFLGEIEVEALLPNGNGTYSQLVGSDGNSTDNYLLVDDSTAPNDADYVGSATSGQKDTYQLTNLARSASVVRAVQLSMRAKKSDTGAISARRVFRTGATDATGSDISLATSFGWYSEIVETNPVSGLNWTDTDINGLEAGYEVRP